MNFVRITLTSIQTPNVPWRDNCAWGGNLCIPIVLFRIFFLDNNISIEPHEIISLNMESLDRLVNLMLARLETINVDHGRQLDLLARSYLDKQLSIFPTTEIVKRIGFS